MHGLFVLQFWESAMNDRLERFDHNASGCITMGGKELFFKLKDMSLTGFLAELDDNFFLKSKTECNAELAGLGCDIRFHVFSPEMSGIAKLVLVEPVRERLLIALQFSVINFAAGFKVFKRCLPRKEMPLNGRLFWQDQCYDFKSEDVSLNGLSVKMASQCSVTGGELISIELPRLCVSGSARVKWLMPEASKLGLAYSRLIYNREPNNQ